MPNNIQLTVSDPVSAMVVAAFNFLSTPAGQNVCADIRTVIIDLVNHVHNHVDKADTKPA